MQIPSEGVNSVSPGGSNEETAGHALFMLYPLMLCEFLKHVFAVAQKKKKVKTQISAKEYEDITHLLCLRLKVWKDIWSTSFLYQAIHHINDVFYPTDTRGRVFNCAIWRIRWNVLPWLHLDRSIDVVHEAGIINSIPNLDVELIVSSKLCSWVASWLARSSSNKRRN